MTFHDIEVASDGPVLTVRLNRPKRLNAISPQMLSELFEVLTDPMSAYGARVLLLTGAGRGFCSGADLVDTASSVSGAAIGDLLRDVFNPLLVRLHELPIPTVAAINGPAAGAGVGLALACDIAIASRDASFFLSFARIGAVLDAGTSWLIPRLVGRARAYAMSLLAEPIDAETAARWGLIWHVVDGGALMEQALVLARKLADGPTHAYELIKEELRAAPDTTLRQQLDLERRCQADAFESADLREGVAAYNERRLPSFSGK